MAESSKPNAKLPFFTKTRAGVPLTKEEVRFIRKKRKELRKDLRKEGITSKKDFEVTASSLGYYFDKKRSAMFFAWLFSGRALPLVIGLMVAIMGVTVAISRITQLRGFFTVNLNKELLNRGFSLRQQYSSNSHSAVLNLGDVGEAVLFQTTMTYFPEDLDKNEGNHSSTERYFAYSFYIVNAGESTESYNYRLEFNRISNNVDDFLWAMLIVSDVDAEGNVTNTQMAIYAKQNINGGSEILPWDDQFFPQDAPICTYYKNLAKFPQQFVANEDPVKGTRYKIEPIPFQSEMVIVSDQTLNIAPGCGQKFTVVLWPEGNDPDICSNYPGNSADHVNRYLDGGSAGLGMQFEMIEDN